MPNQLTTAAEQYLERLSAVLDVPQSRYEEAIRRYQSVGEWLNRDESTLQDYAPDVYVQGSFSLGTPIRPLSEQEDYDIDLVCELSLTKTAVTQKDLKDLLHRELALYAKRHQMQAPSEGRRCWTLDYAEGAQFHLDALPAIPDSQGKRLLLEASALTSDWVDTAIAITDNEHAHYKARSSTWPHSNPRGFSKWFRSRMNEVFHSQRMAMALEARMKVEDVPEYQVKTPLQRAIQILKRHRDMMFSEDVDDKPISIILTTLAAQAYKGEANVGLALQGILSRMADHIVLKGGVSWIPNPTDPQENFADRWQTHPQRKSKFYQWLEQAQADLARISQGTGRQQINEAVAPVFGARIARETMDLLGAKANEQRRIILPKYATVLSASHRQSTPWPTVQKGRVTIARATYARRGFRTKAFYHDGTPLPKFASLRFEAQTDVPAPYTVYWQVVNTGAEANSVPGGLRGGFDEGSVSQGAIARSERTAYSGSHSIECFIVKDGYLVARSGAFIVNVA